MNEPYNMSDVDYSINIDSPCGGGIIFNDKFTQCILVETKKGHKSHPKGKINKNELFYRGVFREIKEETGISPHKLTVIRHHPLIELSEKGFMSVQYIICHTSFNNIFEYDKTELLGVQWSNIENALKDTKLKPRRRQIIQEALDIANKFHETINGNEIIDIISKIEDLEKDYKKLNRISRNLTRLLRHQILDYDLNAGLDGYVKVEDILKLDRFHNLDINTIIAVINSGVDEKKRLNLIKRPDGYYLRANQGHNANLSNIIKSDHLMTLITQPLDVCIHGTSSKYIDAIKKHGLSRMSRTHIHMIPAEPNADEIISGLKTTSNILIYIDMQKAMSDGIKFYLSENNVVLSDGNQYGIIEPKYFKLVKFI